MSLDLSYFNTPNLSNMCCMFSGCNSLTTLDLSNFNTKNMLKIAHIYYNCNSLISYKLPKFEYHYLQPNNFDDNYPAEYNALLSSF